ncbi:alpha-amylase family glycosyl hydrolase [uncultured Rikenella sp.]|uniref:alpha-amylase family glycosyl hydrolase n=1 Tax=uncultured Rikenella sp. TaxID=368003 RepID=UPI0026114BB4|nr:alpha-amylase family glycosyl hydrolase [uncultured Rikenella sp.]
MKRFFLAAIALVSVMGGSTQARTAPSPLPQWLDTAVFYQIYPASFKDSDGDGIGDLGGILSELDYIHSIGVTAIWMNPIFCSEFRDGGYDVTDFYTVAPRYGTNAQLVRLVREAHARGIKVCLDLVAGHTSDRHPWFLQSRQADTALRYSDYYIWTDADSILPPGSNYVRSDAPREGNYLKNFFDCQPALNYGFARPNPANPWEQSVDAPGPQAVRRELKNIIAFWMDKGVDGFRVDMASSLIKNDPGHVATRRLWHEMRAWFGERYPEGVLISEWSRPEEALAAGFHIDFMMQFGTPGFPSLFFNKEGVEIKQDTCYFQTLGAGQIREFVENYTRQREKTRGLGYIALPTANHDCQRLACGDRTDPRQLKVALTFLLTLPGTPFIYYGDEIGMRFLPDWPEKEGSIMGRNANRSGSRTPMQWAAGPTAGFSAGPADSLYLPLDPDPQRPTVEAQNDDPASLLNYVRGLLALRKRTAALATRGEWQLVGDIGRPYPMVYLRRAENGPCYLVAVNPSGRRVEAELPVGYKGRYVYGTGLKDVRWSAGKESVRIAMKPVSAAVFRLDGRETGIRIEAE